MGWAKFDDQFTQHPKVLAAGAWAELLAVRAVIYSARYETDGRIAASQLRSIALGIPNPGEKAQRLVEVGLWDEIADGWVIHDFLEYNPSRVERERVRAEARERMRNVRANKQRTSRNPVPDPVPHTTSSSNGFTTFHAQRAVEAVAQRQKQGLPVKSPRGLAKAMSEDPEFIAESQRLWAHQRCDSCKGKGFTETYAPGAGTRRIPCEEPV